MHIRLFALLSLLILFVACAPPAEESPDEAVEEVTLPPMDDVAKQLTTLGIDLPTPSKPLANYVNAVRTGNLVFLAGKGPTRPDGTRITGKLGEDLSIEAGYEAARVVGINQLAALQAEIGDLNKVRRIVKVLGMVNSTPDFTDQPKVVNGFSDLMVEVFGERGKHARAAVGMAALPSNIAVEIEMIVEVE
ncbi:MAG: RidA family protein [Bacteroidota bacterium]